jgi:ribosomal protein L30/L7E
MNYHISTLKAFRLAKIFNKIFSYSYILVTGWISRMSEYVAWENGKTGKLFYNFLFRKPLSHLKSQWG